MAVCDVDAARRDYHRKLVDDLYRTEGNTEFKGCAGYNDFREVLARQEMDAVVIAVPNYWHA